MESSTLTKEHTSSTSSQLSKKYIQNTNIPKHDLVIYPVPNQTAQQDIIKMFGKHVAQNKLFVYDVMYSLELYFWNFKVRIPSSIDILQLMTNKPNLNPRLDHVFTILKFWKTVGSPINLIIIKQNNHGRQIDWSFNLCRMCAEPQHDLTLFIQDRRGRRFFRQHIKSIEESLHEQILFLVKKGLCLIPPLLPKLCIGTQTGTLELKLDMNPRKVIFHKTIELHAQEILILNCLTIRQEFNKYDLPNVYQSTIQQYFKHAHRCDLLCGSLAKIPDLIHRYFKIETSQEYITALNDLQIPSIATPIKKSPKTSPKTPTQKSKSTS